jgi:hypothetical protein
MATRSLVQPLPPVLVHLATKVSFHRFDDVARVGVQTHAARFLQGFQSQRSRDDLGLLVCGFAQIGTECPPKSLVPKQRHRCRARGLTAVAETRAVTEDGDEFGWTTVW